MRIKMQLKPLFAMGVFALMTASAGSSWAASAADVARLGKDLTPTGAEKAGNKDGSIPAWGGGLTTRPAGLDASNPYADPFASEKPLYTVTAANMAQYKDKLTPGQMALLKSFPSYKMNVYASQRTAAMPQQQYDNIKAEAGAAALVSGGNGIANVAKSSTPFPIPQSGVEVIWNHVTRYRGGNIIRNSNVFPVQTNGAFTAVSRTETASWASSMDKPEPNRLFYYFAYDSAPASLAGSSLMVIEPMNQADESRQVWTYNPGSRRVMRAPEVAYDSPSNGADGLATVDDYDGFNGSPDRYDWKLVGKKEMLISYNNYRMLAPSVKPTDLVKPGHMNQDLVRYEPHRVWVVEATLKAGKRHVYAKRVFYIDEDSWQIAHADSYDGRGELWRAHELNSVQFYNAPATWMACEVQYDLQARRYLVTGLVNATKPIKFGAKIDRNTFTTDAMKRASN